MTFSLSTSKPLSIKPSPVTLSLRLSLCRGNHWDSAALVCLLTERQDTASRVGKSLPAMDPVVSGIIQGFHLEPGLYTVLADALLGRVKIQALAFINVLQICRSYQKILLRRDLGRHKRRNAMVRRKMHASFA